MAANKTKNKRQTKSETVSESFALFLKWLVGALTTIYAVLILGVLPFYFEEGYTHIGTDKSTFYKSCTVLFAKLLIPVMILWLLFEVIVAVGKRRTDKTWKPEITLNPADWFALAYGANLLLSYCFTDFRKTALWGTSGWYMGLLPHLTLVCIYFLVSRRVMKPKYLLCLCIPVSAATFALGYLNRFDIWPIPMENSGLPLYISTVGNINWFCGYIVTVVFVGIGFLWLDDGKKIWRTVLMACYTCLGFAALITQGSDSGLFALAVVLLVMFVMSSRSEDTRRMKQFWMIVGLLGAAGMITMCLRVIWPEQINHTSGLIDLLTYSMVPVLIVLLAGAGYWYTGRQTAPKVWPVVCRLVCCGVAAVVCGLVIMIAVNTAKPGSLGALSSQPVFTFNNSWGSSRGGTWRMGLACFAEQDVLHKLVGLGPDCMAEYLYKGGSEELQAEVRGIFVNKRLTNAHNELITLLANEGICGVVSFFGLLFSLMRRFLKSFEKNTYAAVCGLCLLGYMANNIWSFQQSLSVSTVFVMIGLGACFLRMEEAAN